MRPVVQRRTRGGTIRFRNLAEANASPILTRASAAVVFEPSFALLKSTRDDDLLVLRRVDSLGKGKGNECGYGHVDRQAQVVGSPNECFPASRKALDRSETALSARSGNISPFSSPAVSGVVLERRRSRAASLVASVDESEGILHLDPLDPLDVLSALSSSNLTLKDEGGGGGGVGVGGKGNDEVKVEKEPTEVCVISVGGSVQGWRRTMEDRLVYFTAATTTAPAAAPAPAAAAAAGAGASSSALDESEAKEAQTIGILLLDGHRGSGAADFVRDTLPAVLTKELSEHGRGECRGRGGLLSPHSLGGGDDEAGGGRRRAREVPVDGPLYDAVVKSFLLVDGQLLEEQVKGKAKAATVVADIKVALEQFVELSTAPAGLSLSSRSSAMGTSLASSPPRSLNYSFLPPLSPADGHTSAGNGPKAGAHPPEVHPPEESSSPSAVCCAGAGPHEETAPAAEAPIRVLDSPAHESPSTTNTTVAVGNAPLSPSVGGAASATSAAAAGAIGGEYSQTPSSQQQHAHANGSPAHRADAENACDTAAPLALPFTRVQSVHTNLGLSPCSHPSSATSLSPAEHGAAGSSTTTAHGDASRLQRRLSITRGFSLPCEVAMSYDHCYRTPREEVEAAVRHSYQCPPSHRGPAKGRGPFSPSSLSASASCGGAVTAGEAVKLAVVSVSLHGGRGFTGALFPEDEDNSGGGDNDNDNDNDNVLGSSLCRSDTNPSMDTLAGPCECEEGFYTSHHNALPRGARDNDSGRLPPPPPPLPPPTAAAAAAAPSNVRTPSADSARHGNCLSLLPTPMNAYSDSDLPEPPNSVCDAEEEEALMHPSITSCPPRKAQTGEGRQQPTPTARGEVVPVPGGRTRSSGVGGVTYVKVPEPVHPPPFLRRPELFGKTCEDALQDGKAATKSKGRDSPEEDSNALCEVNPSQYLSDVSGTTALLLLVRLSAPASSRCHATITAANLGDCQAFLVERSVPPSADADAEAEAAKRYYGYPPLHPTKPIHLPSGFAFTKLTSDHRPSVNAEEEARLIARFGRSSFLPSHQHPHGQPSPTSPSSQGNGEELKSEAEERHTMAKRVGGRLAVSRTLGDFDLKLSRLPVNLLSKCFHSVTDDTSSQTLSQLLMSCVVRTAEHAPHAAESCSADDTSAAQGLGQTALAATAADDNDGSPFPSKTPEKVMSALLLSNVPEVRAFTFESGSIHDGADEAQRALSYKLLVGGSDGVWELQSIAHIAERAERHLQPILQAMNAGRRVGWQAAAAAVASDEVAPAARLASCALSPKALQHASHVTRAADGEDGDEASKDAPKWRWRLQEALQRVIAETLQAGISTSQPLPSGGIGGDNMALTLTLIL